MASTLATIVITMSVSYVAFAKDAVTKEDLQRELSDVRAKLDEIQKEEARQEAQIQQTDIDVARIATKLEITAHPVATPR